MLEIAIRRDGRSWYGRKHYRVDMRSSVGTLDVRNLTAKRAADFLRPIITKMLAEERPWSATDQCEPSTMKFRHD